jgi:outer membrane protein TolC
MADNQMRVTLGTMAPIDFVQAQAEQANHRQTLTEAEATAETAEITLERLIVRSPATTGYRRIPEPLTASASDV